MSFFSCSFKRFVLVSLSNLLALWCSYYFLICRNHSCISVYSLAALGFRCFAQVFSSCGEWGLLRHGALTSHCGGFPCCRAQAPGARASAAAGCRLSCAPACGIFLDQGLDCCPLHWQVDSYPIATRKSPPLSFWHW